MSDDFPLKVEKVVELLRMLAPTGKQMAKLRDFIEGKLPNGFPVKLDIPVFPTVSARVVFKHYSDESISDKVFEVPSSFRVCTLYLW